KGQKSVRLLPVRIALGFDIPTFHQTLEQCMYSLKKILLSACFDAVINNEISNFCGSLGFIRQRETLQNRITDAHANFAIIKQSGVGHTFCFTVQKIEQSANGEMAFAHLALDLIPLASKDYEFLHVLMNRLFRVH